MLGQSLSTLFKFCKKRFSTETTAKLAIMILEAIERFHELNYIHRDIKPANFMLGVGEHKDKVYLIDYGLS